jgi:uracil-DNA glycosylase family 4
MSTVNNQYYLEQMGINVWTKRDSRKAGNPLAELARTVSTCVRCPLSQHRTQTVFSRGNPNAPLMIIGEAPGFYEDKQGLPFVGKAGILLNQMLKSIDLNEDEVYIANILKCRPPDNRDPKSDEIEQCSEHLTQQIAIVAPKLLLAVGRFSGQFLARKNQPLKELRQNVHYYNDIPCLVSYHPAYLLRNPSDKKKAYGDLVRLKGLLSSLK